MKDENGIMCGGHGTCQCNKELGNYCKCDLGWEGSDCSCTSDVDTCISPYDGQVCSNNGNCQCGTCRCNEVAIGGQTFKGEFCQGLENDGSCLVENNLFN